ncbi:MAG: glutaredoxin family protein [Candidatus Paceibacterota bacterium]
MKKVKIYTTPLCPWCQVTKDFLKSYQIEFEEIDVSQDVEKAKEMVQKSGQYGVPVIEIDGQIVVGFNKALLEELLGLKGKNEKENKE